MTDTRMTISRNKIGTSHLFDSRYFYGQLLSSLIDVMLAHTWRGDLEQVDRR